MFDFGSQTVWINGCPIWLWRIIMIFLSRIFQSHFNWILTWIYELRRQDASQFICDFRFIGKTFIDLSDGILFDSRNRGGPLSTERLEPVSTMQQSFSRSSLEFPRKEKRRYYSLFNKFATNCSIICCVIAIFFNRDSDSSSFPTWRRSVVVHWPLRKVWFCINAGPVTQSVGALRHLLHFNNNTLFKSHSIIVSNVRKHFSSHWTEPLALQK